MKRQYFPIKILYNLKIHHLLWYSNDEDGLLIDKKMLKSFGTKTELEEYANKKKMNLQITHNPSLYDFDQLERWAKTKTKNIDLLEVLNSWTLFNDICFSLNLEVPQNTSLANEKLLDKLYDLTVWTSKSGGRITESGLEKLSENEIIGVKEIIEKGIQIFQSNLI